MNVLQVHPCSASSFRVLRFNLSLAFCLGAAASVASAQGPVAVVSPTSLSFGQQVVGTTTVGTVGVASEGTAPLLISDVTADNPAFLVDWQNCYYVDGFFGGPCAISISFVSQVSAAYTATLTITDNAPDSPQTVPLTATSTAIEIQPDKLKFHLVQPGQVTLPLSASITNKGTSPVNISSIGFTGSGASQYNIKTNICPQTLAPAATCAVSVVFAPVVPNKAEASLTVTDDDPESPQVIPVHGDGTFIQITPAIVRFGQVHYQSAAPPIPVTVTNTGTVDIPITSVTTTNFEKPYSFDIQANGCPAILAAGASCIVQVGFTPERHGVMKGQLVITDAEGGSPQTNSLFGGAQ